MQRAIPVVIALLACAPALAQQTRDGGDTAPLQAAIQQLTLERSELQTENRELQEQLDKARADLEASNAQLAALRADARQLETSLQQSSAVNTRSEQVEAQLRSQIDEIVAEFRSTIEVLRQTEIELSEKSAELAAIEGERNQCVASNRSLYETGIEVLDRYEEKGCFESARQAGPFTQLKRVELENLVDGYRWQLEDSLLPENAPQE